MTTDAVQPHLDGLEPRRDSSPMSGVPPRPTPTAILRGRCDTCGQYPSVNESTGLLVRHNYHRSDSRDRRGRCSGTKTLPISYHWLDITRLR